MTEFWQEWQPLIIIAGVWFILLSLGNTLVIAIALVMAVSLSPELPLDLPLRIEDFVLLWAVILFGVRLAMGRTSWPQVLNQRPWLALLGIELLATLIGASQATTRLDLTVYSGTIFLAKSIETFLLYVIVIWALDTPAKIRKYSWALLLGGALLGTYGLTNMLTGNSPIEGVVVDIEGGQTYSLIALALLPPLALGLSLSLIAQTKIRWVAMILLVPVVYAFIATLSRQAYVGTAAMICVILWHHNRRLLFGVVPLLLLVLWLYPQVVPESIIERTTSIVDPLTGDEIARGSIYGEYGVYTTRIHAWQRRFPEMWSTNPFTGRGLASLPPGFLDSQYLVILYYTGFVGLFIFLRLLYLFGRQSWWLYRSASEPLGQALGLAGLGAVIGFGVAGLGGSPFVAIRAREMFWLLMAGMAAYSVQLRKECYDKESVDYS